MAEPPYFLWKAQIGKITANNSKKRTVNSLKSLNA